MLVAVLDTPMNSMTSGMGPGFSLKRSRTCGVCTGATNARALSDPER